MHGFAGSLRTYEAGLTARFGTALRQDDLALKHARMRKSAFLFLRATCWRWAECAAALCPALMDAPTAGSIGDAHAGNFGLWRDAESRLVWGVNDYDEAARLPYALDLVRLCASILVADSGTSAHEVTGFALDAYAGALAAPLPSVLEGDRIWLRDLFQASDADRAEFWSKVAAVEPQPVDPPGLRAPLLAALPAEMAELRIAPRSAGAGSLGRPRFVACGTYRGGPLAAEIKGAMPSCWGGGEAGLAGRIAGGAYRSPNPTLIYHSDYVVRRLSPDSRKLDFDEISGKLRGRLIAAMAADMAAVHAGDADVAAIARDLGRRPEGWLADAARAVADWTIAEWDDYRRRSG